MASATSWPVNVSRVSRIAGALLFQPSGRGPAAEDRVVSAYPHERRCRARASEVRPSRTVDAETRDWGRYIPPDVNWLRPSESHVNHLVWIRSPLDLRCYAFCHALRPSGQLA